MPLVAERLRWDETETLASRLYGMAFVDSGSSTSAREANPIISYYHNTPIVTGRRELSFDETRPNQLARPSVQTEQLSELEQLTDDWDGDGGVPPTREAVATARQILEIAGALAEYLGMDSSVDPLPNGGLDMEWISRAENQLLAEIHPNGGDVSFAVCTKNTLDGRREYSSNRLFDLEQILPLLLWLDG